jgi:hypothetical protein
MRMASPPSYSSGNPSVPLTDNAFRRASTNNLSFSLNAFSKRSMVSKSVGLWVRRPRLRRLACWHFYAYSHPACTTLGLLTRGTPVTSTNRLSSILPFLRCAVLIIEAIHGMVCSKVPQKDVPLHRVDPSRSTSRPVSRGSLTRLWRYPSHGQGRASSRARTRRGKTRRA